MDADKTMREKDAIKTSILEDVRTQDISMDLIPVVVRMNPVEPAIDRAHMILLPDHLQEDAMNVNTHLRDQNRPSVEEGRAMLTDSPGVDLRTLKISFRIHLSS